MFIETHFTLSMIEEVVLVTFIIFYKKIFLYFPFQTSKLVLDEYFSGEPVHDFNPFYNFNTLPQPILPDEFTPSTPLSPPESLPSPDIVNGDKENDETGKCWLDINLCVAFVELI